MMRIFLVLWLSGCASYQVRDDYVASADRLFPDGTYRHEVTVRLREGKTQHFSGVVKLGPRHIEVVGLSFLGTSVFRLTDDFAGEPKIEIYVSLLEKYRERVGQFYPSLKKLLLIRANERPRDVTIEELDEKRIPRHLVLNGEKFTVEVKVTGYEI